MNLFLTFPHTKKTFLMRQIMLNKPFFYFSFILVNYHILYYRKSRKAGLIKNFFLIERGEGYSVWKFNNFSATHIFT